MQKVFLFAWQGKPRGGMSDLVGIFDTRTDALDDLYNIVTANKAQLATSEGGQRRFYLEHFSFKIPGGWTKE